MEIDETAEADHAPAPMPVREASSVAIGLVVSGSVIAAAAGQEPPLLALCVGIVGSVVVYWLAGVYAAALASGIRSGRRIFQAALGIAGRSWSVPASSLLPVGALVIATALGADMSTAAATALLASIAVLFAYGYLAGRAAGLSPVGRVGSALVGAAFGVGLLILKGVVGH